MIFEDFRNQQIERCQFEAQVFRLMSSLIFRKRDAKPAKRLTASYRMLYGSWYPKKGTASMFVGHKWWDNLLKVAEHNPIAIDEANRLLSCKWPEIKDYLYNEVDALDELAKTVQPSKQAELAARRLVVERQHLYRAFVDRPLVDNRPLVKEKEDGSQTGHDRDDLSSRVRRDKVRQDRIHRGTDQQEDNRATEQLSTSDQTPSQVQSDQEGREVPASGVQRSSPSRRVVPKVGRDPTLVRLPRGKEPEPGISPVRDEDPNVDSVSPPETRPSVGSRNGDLSGDEAKTPPRRIRLVTE